MNSTGSCLPQYERNHGSGLGRFPVVGFEFQLPHLTFVEAREKRRGGIDEAGGISRLAFRPIRSWELLRFDSKLEKSSDEVEDVKDDRPIDPHQAIELLASRLTL